MRKENADIKRRNRRRKAGGGRKKTYIILGIIAGLVVAAGVGLFIFYQVKTDLVYKEVMLEAGSEAPDITEFLKRPEENVTFSKDSTFDTAVPGDYKLTINYKMPIFGTVGLPTTLHITDTVAPEVTTVESYRFFTFQKETPEASDLVTAVKDATKCEVAYAKDYDFTKVGEFDVEIVVTDLGGNTTKASVPCEVIEDTKAPTIEGVAPLAFCQGDTISYTADVTVTDDYDEHPSLEVDTSKVNPDKRGIYPIVYTATDASGNKATAETTIQIKSMIIAAATPDTVNGMADAVLAEITTPDMSQLDQAKAVYDWVVDNITYSESAGIDDLYSAAYRGLYNRVGDCTVKQKTAEVMLNRLGIKNMEIEKIRDTRGHYWLLIDVGEGWYHYDPNLQLDGTTIFYWHDADLWEYSNAHHNTHNYDPSKYPTIQ